MVSENLIKFIKICDELGLNEKIKELDKDFDKRLFVQKVFYFLIKMGFNFRLKYNFYKYGPYSPKLADLYYKSLEIHGKKINNFPQIEFNEVEIKILEILKRILDKWGNNPKKLEFYSSVLYVHEDMYFKEWSIENIKIKIMNLKPELYNLYKLDIILNELKDSGLIRMN